MSVDILQEKIRKMKNPSVLELAPIFSELPPHIAQEEATPAAACVRFGKELLEQLKGIVPAVRVSFAAFALLGPEGIGGMIQVLQSARENGYYVLLDAPEALSPRTAAAMAEGLLGQGSAYPCDGLVIGGYLGSDVIKPFLNYCKKDKKDLFVVARTANKSAPELQDLLAGSRLVHVAAADHVNRYGADTAGKFGYTRVGVLAAACKKVEDHPFKAHIEGPAAQMFDTLGRYSTPLYRVIFANMWCFGWVIDMLGRLSGGEMNALVRTTVAFTQMEGSSARNVIPPAARIVANMRLNPYDDVESALAYLRKTVNNPKVRVSALESFQPSRVSQVDCPAWDKVSAAVAETWPDCIVSPYLMVQCSDSRHYGAISDKVYRFSAMDLTKEERGTIHGNDERIPLATIAKTVEFYIRLIKQC